MSTEWEEGGGHPLPWFMDAALELFYFALLFGVHGFAATAVMAAFVITLIRTRAYEETTTTTSKGKKEEWRERNKSKRKQRPCQSPTAEDGEESTHTRACTDRGTVMCPNTKK